MVFVVEMQLPPNSHPSVEAKTTVNILKTRRKEKDRAANHLKMMAQCNCMFRLPQVQISTVNELIPAMEITRSRVVKSL